MSCKNVHFCMDILENAQKGSDHFHALLHFYRCGVTSSTLIRPLPCTFTFFHDIFHNHQTTSMYLNLFARHFPHSSDHFHAPLHFCKTFSTLIRPLSCSITFLHDIFHTHQTSGLMSVEVVVYHMSKVHQTSSLMQCGTFLHDIFHTHQSTSMYLGTFVHNVFHTHQNTGHA